MVHFAEKTVISERQVSPPTSEKQPPGWFRCWEFYVLLGASTFFNLYELQRSQFDTDQANMFEMARDAITHGFLPLTSNTSSIGTLNPPGFEYFLLPAAALSSSPYVAVLSVALCGVAATILTYFFTRRYFGRLAATAAGLISVAATVPLHYTRLIWQPSILPLLVILYMFAIYRGAVDRKHGWLAWALLLLGIMYQMHSATLPLAALIIMAIVMAPGSVRKRDILLAGAVLLLVLLPYLFWEILNNWHDIQGIITFSHLPAKFDQQGLLFYIQLISPYNGFHANLAAVTVKVITILLLAGTGTALLLIIRSNRGNKDIENATDQKGLHKLWSRWQRLCTNRIWCASLLLLAWQVIPLIVISHHAVALHMQYLLMFLPGPYILMGLFLGQTTALIRQHLPKLALPAQAISLLLIIVLFVQQSTASGAYLIKMTGGHFNERTVQNLPYIDDIESISDAFQTADQIAKEHHLKHVYVTMDSFVTPTMSYMAETMTTPTTAFDDGSCMVLPSAATGPGVFLVSPYATLTNEILSRFTSATLIKQSARLGGPPFNLYIVQPGLHMPDRALQGSNLTGSLTLANDDTQVIPYHNQERLVSVWQLQTAKTTQPRVYYNYQLQLSAHGLSPVTSDCILTSQVKGDQLIATFPLPAHHVLPKSVSINVITSRSGPDLHQFGPLTFTSQLEKTTGYTQLHTATGGKNLHLISQ